MNFEFQFNRTKSYALIIKDYCVRFCETRGKEFVEVKQVFEHFLPPGIIENGKIVDIESLMMILEECMTNWKIRKKDVFLIVPDSVLFFRKIAIPTNVMKDEIQGYLHMEIGTSIHLPFDEPIFDYYYLGRDEHVQNILLFAAPTDVIEDYVEACTYAKLLPKVMDSSSLALYRLYKKYYHAEENEKLLIIQFDLKSVVLSFFEGYIPTFIRQFNLEMGANKWEGKLGDTGTINYSFRGNQLELEGVFQDAVTEIEKVIHFYQYSMNQGQKQIQKIMLTGDHPKLERIKEILQTRLSVSVDQFQLLEHAKGLENYNTDAICLNIGLSLKEVK